MRRFIKPHCECGQFAIAMTPKGRPLCPDCSAEGYGDEDEGGEPEEQSDAAFLKALTMTLFKNATPAMGIDQADCERLERIATKLEDHPHAD
ncbi:hypothetical protein [Novosphingopyxis sp. YJ-S2-01]|uniref:hypothetical protein n=1 Tax=Novosphingopyxis sp. YJ-S2-01 TaxID=2794021 RepID=UPI0018DB7886|nr:hypothetical protein [Novosphingopyxis sp. YJ-S2-01]MBH9537546.1 hypothetical protein [Novosphingopyxis sp. YJ-S2-01]